MSNYPAGAEFDSRAPWNDDGIFEDVVERLTEQVISEFRNMLMERLIEDVRHEVYENYSYPDGMEDHKDDIYEAVYEAAYEDITHRWNRYE